MYKKAICPFHQNALTIYEVLYSFSYQVRVSMFKGGKEKAYVVFDANGADKNNWFDKSRILYTNWNNLSPSATTNYFDIVG
jgi:hypothetical protein